MKTLKYILLFFISVIGAGCFDLDSSLFNNKKLTSYTLSSTVIPESSRTLIVLSSQGKKIYGYFVRSADTLQRNIILYNHGNRDHILFYWDRVELFYRMGFNVFIYDYQGYGMSEGEPTESGIYSDANTAYNYVRSLGFSDGEITVYGFSLGGAAAVHLSSTVFSPKKLILESPFASTSALTQSATLLDLPSSFIMKGEYNNAEKIKRSVAPLLIIFGVDDTFIDMEKNGKVVYRNANNPKEFREVTGAGHSDIPAVLGFDAYNAVVRTFVLK